MKNKIRVILCGMTGYGNAALRGLRETPSMELVGVVCPRSEAKPFPHYECPKIYDEAAQSGIQVLQELRMNDPMAAASIAGLRPELMVVCSFRQIIPAPIIAIPRFGVINIHPSLLPRYRGATPSVWAILNGEKETGVTIHFIDDERLDAGRVVAQRKIEILPDEVDGSLRRRLAELAHGLIKEAALAVTTRPKESFPRQDESLSCWFPMRGPADTLIDPARPLEEIKRRIRANSPWPGARLLHEEREHIVSGVEQGEGPATDGILSVESNGRTLRFKLTSPTA